MDKEDLTFLNPMASKMLPRDDDPGLMAVKRLQRELGDLNTRLPKRSTLDTAVSNHLKKFMAKKPTMTH